MHLIPNKSAAQYLVSVAIFLAGLIFYQAGMASDLGLAEADCRSCHGPTMADRHHMMVLSRGFQCFKCHSFVQDPDTLMNEVTVTRNCLVCHTGSLADRHHALVDRKILDCLTCHEVSWDPDQMAYSVGFRFSAAGFGVISGVVTDNSLAPLAGVKVTTNTGAYVATTAADGSYLLDPVTVATYKLTATKPGYVDQTVRLRVAAGETTTADLQLAAAPAPLVVIEQCSDGVDNDGDGLTDCADAACTTDSSCQLPPAEICDNGLDDDLDGAADCSDSDCAGHTVCTAGGSPPTSVMEAVIKPAESALPPPVAPSPGSTATSPPVATAVGDVPASDAVPRAEEPQGSTEPGSSAEGTGDNNANAAGDDQDDSADEAVAACSDPAACDNGESPPDPGGVQEVAQTPSPDATQEAADTSLQPETTQPVSRAWAPRIRLSAVKGPVPAGQGKAGSAIPSPGKGVPAVKAAKTMGKVGAIEKSMNQPVRTAQIERCGDGIDNDGNGLADCADSQCAAYGSCQVSAVEICDNGTDDDRDGFADCRDNYCVDEPVCALANFIANPEFGTPAAVPGLAPPGVVSVTAYPPPVTSSRHLAQAVQLQLSPALHVAPGGDINPAGQSIVAGLAPLAGLKSETQKAVHEHGEAQSDRKHFEMSASPIVRLKLSARLMKQRPFDAIALSTFADVSGDDPVRDAGITR